MTTSDMKALFLLILCAVAISSHTVIIPTTNAAPAETVRYDKGIEKYVLFLEQQKQTPQDYILNLFQRNDLVVLCERPHPEITQYDMIYELVSDPRFQRQAGSIFTEVGSADLRPYLESFLMDDQLSDEQVNERLRYIAKHIGWVGVWEETNFYDFLRKLHQLNRSLPRDRRIRVYPSDLEFNWENATKATWAEFTKKRLPRRDQIMADNIIGKFNEIRQGTNRNGALVIMNYRHAFSHLKREDGGRFENTEGFLTEAYPGKVANVMLNAAAPLSGSNEHQWLVTATQDGKWDAAFAVLGNPALGFDFKGSPLGEDGFDYFPLPTHLRYQDVFTGFVFFKPLKDHRISSGLPRGVFDQTIANELLKRFQIMGTYSQFAHLQNMTRGQIAEMMGTVRIVDYNGAFGKSDYAERIQQWLKAGP